MMSNRTPFSTIALRNSARRTVRPDKTPNTLGHKAGKIEIERIVSMWLDSFHSPVTRQNYRYTIDKFHQEATGDLLTLKALFFEEWAKQKLLNGSAPTSIKTTLTVLSSFYSYVCSKISGFSNPVRGFRLRLSISEHDQVRKIRRRAFTQDQLKIIYARMDLETKRLGQEPLEIFCFKMLVNSLMRVSELLSLEAFDPAKAGECYFNYVEIRDGRAYVLVCGKNKRLREFTLNRDVTVYLLKHRFVPGQKIFLNARGKPLTRNGCQYLFREIKRKYMAGIKIDKVSPHGCRHTGFTLALKRGDVDPIHLAMLGGSSRSVVEKYYMNEAKDVFEEFSVL